METKSYTTINRVKAGWPSGPWDGEPDKVQWPDAATGLPCLVVRNGITGILCGYVGVAPGHPLYGKGYHDVGVDVSVHGDLTFADKCNPLEKEDEGICHVAGPGEPEHVWWFGFDCGHLRDAPPFDPFKFDFGCATTYKTLAFVQDECASLAAQLHLGHVVSLGP